MNRKLLLWLVAAAVALGLLLILMPSGIKAWARTGPLPWSASPSLTAEPGVAGSLSAAASTKNLRAGDLLKTETLQADSVERRLLGVFASIEQADISGALTQSSALTRDYPNYQLGQLVHGDLLQLRFNPTASLDNIANGPSPAAAAQLSALRTETRKRLEALHNRPPPGTVPHQFVALSGWSRHAIAVDAAQSRLYLFENQTPPAQHASQGVQLKLVADFFMSVGKSGTGKQTEGDGRTPLGNYYITSVRHGGSLPPLYGVGALPINYPNAFDLEQKRTGFGIWLHGTPPEQFVRPPLASDGCVVLSNPDMRFLLSTVAPRSTPVVIAESLQWTDPATLAADRAAFMTVLEDWQRARAELNPSEFQQRFGTTKALLTETDAALSQRTARLAPDAASWLVQPNNRLGVAQVSLLQTRTPKQTMLATFEETVNGTATGVIRRQYWQHSTSGWYLLQDTVLAGTPSAQLKRAAAPVVATAPTDSVVVAEATPRPKPTTAPTPPAPASSATAVAATASPSTDRKPTTATPPQHAVATRADNEAVHQAVSTWAKAWSDKNMAAYLKAYAPTFDTPAGQNRKAWEQERRERIMSKSKIDVRLSKVVVHTQGNTATVKFVQAYRADAVNVSSHKTLTLTRRGQQWLITQEEVGR